MDRPRSVRAVRSLGLGALSCALCAVGGRTVGVPTRVASPRLARLPRVTVWAWERREDLRGLDPRTTAVAFLDRTVMVDASGVRVVPRRQPMLLPAVGLVEIAVVRVETRPGAVLSAESAGAVAQTIVGAAGEGSGVAALQVDFDARQSERAWYAEVLRRVRTGMPARMPLSMTALASWCSDNGGWLRGLPVDEAVPMLFRMEPDRRRVVTAGGWAAADAVREFTIREPLCLGSMGISTREPWPREMAGRRVYVFADRGWARDGLEETVRSLQ